MGDVTARGKDVFANGFAVSALLGGGISLKSMADFAYLRKPWSEDTGEPSPAGWMLKWFSTTSFDPMTNEDYPVTERPAIFRANHERMMNFIRATIAHLPVDQIHVARGNENELPLLPLIPQDYPLFAARKKHSLAHFTDFNSFVAAWDTHEELEGGLHLFTRSLDVLDEKEYWRATVNSHLTLTRICRPGDATYRVWGLNEERSRFMNAMPMHQELLGYRDDRNALEYTCYLQLGERLNLRDLYTLTYFRRNDLDGGETVEEAIVTFAKKGMGERELGPLTNVGVTIQYFAEDGTRQTFTEEAATQDAAEDV